MRIVIAIIAGFLTWTAIFLGGFQTVIAAMPDKFDDKGFTTSVLALLLALALSVIASVASGWLAAKVARVANNQPAKILGVILLLVGIGVQASSWSSVPLWYNVCFLLLLFPATVCGGGLVTKSTATNGR